MIEKIKKVLRINDDDIDLIEEAQDLIDAAKADLKLSGVLENKIVDTDSLIARAITIYCKANFGWDNPEAERYQESYNMLKSHLSLSAEYTIEVVSP